MNWISTIHLEWFRLYFLTFLARTFFTHSCWRSIQENDFWKISLKSVELSNKKTSWEKVLVALWLATVATSSRLYHSFFLVNSGDRNPLVIFHHLKTLWLLFVTGFSGLKAAEPLQGDSSLLTTKFLGVPGIHLIKLIDWTDERSSRPWSHQVVLNHGSMDWESSILNCKVLEICLKWARLFVSGCTNIILPWTLFTIALLIFLDL